MAGDPPDGTPDPGTPDPSTPEPTVGGLGPEGPFEGWGDPPPPDTYMGVEPLPDSLTGGDQAFGCFMQVLIAVLLGVLIGFTVLEATGSRAVFGEIEPSTSSSTSTSSTTSSTTTTTLPPVEEYSLGLTYTGACEGSAAFFLRVLDGSTVELHLGEPGGQDQLMATSTIGPPGRSFAFDNVQGSALTFDGQIDGDTVAGTGSWADFGPGCSFTFSGSRR